MVLMLLTKFIPIITIKRYAVLTFFYNFFTDYVFIQNITEKRYIIQKYEKKDTCTSQEIGEECTYCTQGVKA